jgi:hypothetical protein
MLARGACNSMFRFLKRKRRYETAGLSLPHGCGTTVMSESKLFSKSRYCVVGTAAGNGWAYELEKDTGTQRFSNVR